MKLNKKQILLSVLEFLIFFPAVFLYVWLRIDTSIIYHANRGLIGGNFPLFSYGMNFLRDFLRYPSGIIEYLSAFLLQYYYYPVAGALILTAVAWLLFVSSNLLMKQFRSNKFNIISYLPVLVFIVLINKFSPYIANVLSLIISVLSASFYIFVRPKKSLWRLGLFFGLLLILYYVVGGASLVYVLVLAFYEICSNRKNWILSIGYILFGALLPLIWGNYVLGMSIMDSYFRLFHYRPDIPLRFGIVVSLYSFFVLLVLFMALGNRFNFNKQKDISSGKFSDYRIFEVFVIIFVAGAVCFLSFDYNISKALKINFFTNNRMWDKVIEEANDIGNRKISIISQSQINFALFHKGLLSKEMFSYPQSLRGFLVGLKPDKYIKLSPELFELGLVNDAQRIASEELSSCGEHPATLDMLAKISFVKGQKKATKLFLSALSKDVIYDKAAKENLKKLSQGKLFLSDSVINSVKKNMIKKDYAGEYPIDKKLLFLLETNKTNKMAFEYLMAYYLLTKQVDKIYENIHWLKNFNYDKTPNYYQEALLIYHATHRKKKPEGYEISRQTVEIFNAITRITLANGKKRAFELLKEDYGKSYFIYYLF